MGNIIEFRPRSNPNQNIDICTLKSNTRKLRDGLISASIEQEVTYELAGEHTSEPIKSIEDINRISSYLIKEGRYRDNMLFIVGINFGLRVSDLRVLTFSRIINENLTFKERFAILEQKTSNTRKHKKNRYITINDAVVDAVTLYLENTNDVKLSDYMFKSQSNRCSGKNVPIHRNSIDRILKGIADECSLSCKVSTHTLRKTFAYHQMVMSGNDPRKLLLLQKMFGHSTAMQTLDYIGITSEEIDEAYRSLNLGSLTRNYLVDSKLEEGELTAG